MKNKIIISVAAALIFFMLSLLTLKAYGISWDETIHFRRGQAYLYYFLTGLEKYNLPQYNFQGTDGKPSNVPEPRRSFYQNDFHNGEYFLKNDTGHPPLNDELAALSNYIFFQKLGLMDDISAHQLFIIASSALLVFLVVYFALDTFGFFPALISFLALSTYPLFWAESHFNIKDPPEAAFFAGVMLSFYKALTTKKIRWILLTGLFLGLAISTKFNILFVIFIIFPYLAINKSSLLSLVKKYFWAILLSLIFCLAIFFFSWPYLWQNFPSSLMKIMEYYQQIGTNYRYQPDSFFILGFNLFPILWIIYTSPPYLLFLSLIGLVAVWINFRKFADVVFLWLLWLLVPIIRVSVPGTVIYGGIRQIMEFLPAMALISGLGAWQIVQWLKMKKFSPIFCQLILILIFIWPVFVLVKMYPNENIYFNSLIGGLKGAQSANFPSWGNSFGNAYYQGTLWLNNHAEPNAKLALIQGTPANVPALWIRKDISYKNENFSGLDRKGEYLMELTFNDTGKSFYFAWEYVDTFLIPVYEVKVDGVSILKIWKNDSTHTFPNKRQHEISYSNISVIENNGSEALFVFDNFIQLSKIKINLEPQDCFFKEGFIETSLDNEHWFKEKDPIPFAQVSNKLNLSQNTITYYFAGRNAKEIKLNITGTCKISSAVPEVFILK